MEMGQDGADGPDGDDGTAESETGASGAEDYQSPQVSDEVDALFDALADEHRRPAGGVRRPR